MKKIVNVINIIDNRKFGASFIDEETEMNNWIAKQEAKALQGRGWGWGSRDMSKADCIAKGLEILIINEYLKEVKEAYDIPVYELDQDGNPVMEEFTYLDEDEVEQTAMRQKQAVDGNGDPIFDHIDAVFEDWCDLKAEYEITIEDVTVEHEAELQAKADRKAEIAQLKAAYARIDAWENAQDLVADFNFFKKVLKRLIKEMRD